MSKNEEIYWKLREYLTDEEIAEGYMIPDDLSEEQEAKAHADMRALRLAQRANRSEEDRLLSELMRMKLLIRDYLRQSAFKDEFSFRAQLAHYQQILRRPLDTLASDLGESSTALHHLLAKQEMPSIQLLHRLEIHSGGVLPASDWWQLVAKERAHQIAHDTAQRQAEALKVKQALHFPSLD